MKQPWVNPLGILLYSGSVLILPPSIPIPILIPTPICLDPTDLNYNKRVTGLKSNGAKLSFLKGNLVFFRTNAESGRGV